MEKKFQTNKYGEVIVRSAMLSDGTRHGLTDGIEIKSESKDFDLIEILEYYNVEEMTSKDVEHLIDVHS